MTFASISRVSDLVRGARVLLLIGAAATLGSCSMFDDFNPFGGEKYKMVIEPDVPASKAYDQGLAQLANGAPADAAKKLTDLGEKFPDSDWARKGLLMTTYAQYQGGDYDSAESSAERYVKLYPKSQEAAYALYLEASSYYRQIPDISREHAIVRRREDGAFEIKDVSKFGTTVLAPLNTSAPPESEIKSFTPLPGVVTLARSK